VPQRLQRDVPRGRLSLSAVLAVVLLAWAFGRAPRVSGRDRTAPSKPAAPASSTAVPAETVETARSEAGTAPAPATEALASAAGCAELVAAGRRLERPPTVARFASWNLHWFPDGQPGQRGSGADLKWLACALSWLNADVLAVQEVKQTPQAEQALALVLSELNRLSSARYVARFDDCGSRVPQHVGLIWNEARVAARDVETVAALNPHGAACESQLRPGLAARFRLPGGLDLETISAHFKSMADQRGFALRGSSFAAVPGVLRAFTEKTHDADFLLLGDLNTMGCDECSPVVSALEEQAAMAKQLAQAGLRLVPADAAGSEVYGGHVTLLDHALASSSMRELASGARSHVVGFCAAGAKAGTGRAAKQIRRALSDHCPLVLDLIDRDLD
jgi:endonuclease/exonuclease/phosphatase family metal-dependent hydrolase